MRWEHTYLYLGRYINKTTTVSKIPKYFFSLKFVAIERNLIKQRQWLISHCHCQINMSKTHFVKRQILPLNFSIRFHLTLVFGSAHKFDFIAISW